MECTEAMDAVENVFEDFKARKAGMVKALTTDFEEFYKQCDPGKENLCLYGFPSEKWEVRLPEEMVPPELPEPVLGINFVRDAMPKMDWLTEIAAHSEAWLLAVAYHFSTRFLFDKNDRKRLFNMINNLPSLYEVVTCSAEKTSSSSETMRSKYEHEGAKSVEDRDGGNTQSVERVFRDFKGRRAGLLKALTTGVEEFYQLCDPEMNNLCLFGLPNETWEVSLPPQELPQNLPEPALGINFARDGMQKMDWLALVALHSDTWLLSMAYFLGNRFDKAERERLFDKIFDLPTLFEVVVSSSREEVYKKSSHPCHGSNESTSNLKEDSESQAMDVDVMQMQPKKEAEENFEDEHIEEYSGTLCGSFGLNWSFVGEMFGRWKLSIDNGYAPCPQKKM